jgi:hypothetical protein
MNKAFDLNYYAARLRAEREATASATCDIAREVHRELASRYATILAARGHSAALTEVQQQEGPRRLNAGGD